MINLLDSNYQLIIFIGILKEKKIHILFKTFCSQKIIVLK